VGKAGNDKYSMSEPTHHLWLEHAYLPGGWHQAVRLSIDQVGVIKAITQGPAQKIDKRVYGAVIPGVPNIHSHAFQRAIAGLTEHRHTYQRDSFWSWREVMHAFVTRLDPDQYEAIARFVYMEMLKAGYTTVGEFHYLHLTPNGQSYADITEMSGRALAAARETGIGISLLPVMYSRGGYTGEAPNSGQRRCILKPDTFLVLVDRLYARVRRDHWGRVGIAPHSIRQVSPDTLNAVLVGIKDIDTSMPIHIHAAEQLKDVDDHILKTGNRPIRWLLDNTDMNNQWCVVHATHINSLEIIDLAACGAVAGLCPTTEANLGDGLFPLEDYIKADGNWGIGSDSHVSIDPKEELRWLEYGQRLATLSRNVTATERGGSTGRQLFDFATKGGAQGLGQRIGQLTEGYRADLIVMDPEHPALLAKPMSILFDSWIFSASTSPILDVMAAGKWVVLNGRHRDEMSIKTSYKKVLKTLIEDI
tara:strand:+ start:586 stop:2010 length:1425 start_codon:yes stop_codon:yes gene_type:complete